jgi:hypothetical protein
MEILNHINNAMSINFHEDSLLIANILVNYTLEYQDYSENKKAADYMVKGVSYVMGDSHWSIKNVYNLAETVKGLYVAGVPLHQYRKG